MDDTPSESTFFLTFGQDHENAELGADHRGWIEIRARDEEAARHLAFAMFGDGFCMLLPRRWWERADLASKREQHYPHGCTGVLSVALEVVSA